MKPLKIMLAVAGLSFLITAAADARDWDQHGGGGQGDEHRRDRGGGEESSDPRGHGRMEHGNRAYIGGDRGYDRLPPPYGEFVPPGYARADHPGYPPGYGPSRHNWDRGQFLPHNYWAGQAVDPRQHRLRSPPPGFGWYGVGRDAYLVQRSTGLILDTAPGVW